MKIVPYNSQDEIITDLKNILASDYWLEITNQEAKESVLNLYDLAKKFLR